MAFGGARKMTYATLAVGFIGCLHLGSLLRGVIGNNRIEVPTLDWVIALTIVVASLIFSLWLNRRKVSYTLGDWIVGGLGGLFVGMLISILL
jgi:hypothetical protein